MSRIVRTRPEQPCGSCGKSAGGHKVGLMGTWKCSACGARLKALPK